MLQNIALDEANKASPGSYFWIKADACDVLPGIQESVKSEWNGDVDLNDGKLEQAYSQYKQISSKIALLGLGSRRTPQLITEDLQEVQKYIAQMTTDLNARE